MAVTEAMAEYNHNSNGCAACPAAAACRAAHALTGDYERMSCRSRWKGADASYHRQSACGSPTRYPRPLGLRRYGRRPVPSTSRREKCQHCDCHCLQRSCCSQQWL